MKRFWFGLCTFAVACFSFAWAQTPSEFKGHDGLIHSVAFNSDGTILATASFDGTVKLWNYSSGKETQVLKGATPSQVNCVAFSKDGAIVATASLDKMIRLWNPKDGKATAELKGHTEGVSSVAFSPDGTILASCSADKSVRIWDVKSAKELKNLGSHKESVYAVAFNKDGTELASCGNDGVIKIWDVKGQKEIKSLMVDLPKVEVKVEPKKEEKKDDKDKKEVKKGKEMKKEEPKELRDGILVVAFSPDGKYVLSGGFDKYLRYWDLSTGKEAKKLGPTSDNTFGLTISKDGKYVATAGYGGSLRVYELTSGNQVFPEKGKEKETDASRRAWMTYSAVFAPDGKSIVTGHEKSLKIGNVVKVTQVMK
jgi:WD40 repeat protein